MRVSDILSTESSRYMHGRQLLRWNFSKKLIFRCLFCVWKLLKSSQVVKLKLTSCESNHKLKKNTSLLVRGCVGIRWTDRANKESYQEPA